MRYVFLLLLIAASIGIFVTVIIPRYGVIKGDRADVAAYQANLVTANELQQSRNALIAQYNNIPKTDLDNIKTLLPDSVDNIRLIIQLDSLATKNGLSSLRNVDYNPSQATTTAPGATSRTTDAKADQRPYGEFVIAFQTTGQYSNLLSFISDLEQNLRLVDVTNVQFTPILSSTGTQTAASGITYKVTLKTYWLKK
ncbi:MAG: type 4a pilus biogenesis protein PilO [Candidatus Paceibacterota bacterium]